MLARRIYNFSVCGAAGGLVGSLLHQHFVLDTLSKPLAPDERYKLLALLGAMVGASIGFVPRFVEGLSLYSFGRALRLGLRGSFLGALGGLCTLPLAELLHSRLQGGLQGRTLAWGLLGLAIGFAEGLSGGARQWRGLLGGGLGGLLAGCLLEPLLKHQDTYAGSSIVALLAVGLAISLCVALFVNVLSEVWLEGLPGSKVEGQIYHLSKFRGGQEAILGSDKRESLLVWVPDAEPQHAAISLRRDAAVLRNLSAKAPTRVEGMTVTEHVLQDGQIVEIGSARLRYRERRRALRRSPPARVALAIACLLGLGSGVPALASGNQPYNVRITQIDTAAFPRVRLFVSITDQSGRPIPDNHKVALTVLTVENGHEKVLLSNPISDGWSVSTVLAIDGSGSMQEEIVAAREAAKAYVEQAPSSYEIAVLSFADSPTLVQGFTRDKGLLKSRIDGIMTGGQTALQDTVGAALDLLAGRSGRKSLVLLTDGQENASRRYQKSLGLWSLRQRCAAEEVTVSTIGLGTEVDAGYLRTLTASGGIYLPAPQASALQAVFVKQAELLKTEYVLEIASPSSKPDGLRELLTVQLTVDRPQTEANVEFVKPGVLPHITGDHRPYAVALAFLLIAPGAMGTARTLLKVANFRRHSLRRLRSDSPFLGATEVNSGDKLESGDLVVLCPYSRTPHYPRSWRLNRCRCMREPGCSGAFCYQQVLPSWLRRTLDRLSAGQTDETGRRWLCQCQGDKEGY